MCDSPLRASVHAETFLGVYIEGCMVCSFSLRNRREYSRVSQLGLFAMGGVGVGFDFCCLVLCVFWVFFHRNSEVHLYSQVTDLVLLQDTSCSFIAITGFTILDMVKLVLVMLFS